MVYLKIMHKVPRYLILGQASFLFFAVICFVLEPRAFLENAPFSYYGTHRATFIPYAIGILCAVFCITKAATIIRDKNDVIIRKALFSLAVLLVGILASPYSVNGYFFAAHIIVSILLLSVVLGVSSVIVFTRDRSAKSRLFYTCEILTVVALVLSQGFVGILHVHALAELTISLLFIGHLNLTFEETSHAAIKDSRSTNRLQN